VRLIIISKRDKQLLKKAKEVSFYMNSSLLLLSDALYLVNIIEKHDFNEIYAIKNDYKKRFNKDSRINLLDYEELINLLMDNNTSIINL
jgi:hypothetical protein